MSNYVKATDFASKDSLASGNPLKVVKGVEIDDEFESIETAVASKADLASPEFIGIPTTPTAAASTNTTQIASCAFVQSAISNGISNPSATVSVGTVSATTISGTTVTGTTVNAGTVDLGNWTIYESSGYLYFKTGSTIRMRLDASGNLVVEGNITAYGSL